MSTKAAAKAVGCTGPLVTAVLKKEAPDLMIEIARIASDKAKLPVCKSCESRPAKPTLLPYCSVDCQTRGPSMRPVAGLARYEVAFLARLQGFSWLKATRLAGLPVKSMFGVPHRVKIWGSRKGVDVSAAFGFAGEDA